jgi:hypothetical protein
MSICWSFCGPHFLWHLKLAPKGINPCLTTAAMNASGTSLQAAWQLVLVVSSHRLGTRKWALNCRDFVAVESKPGGRCRLATKCEFHKISCTSFHKISIAVLNSVSDLSYIPGLASSLPLERPISCSFTLASRHASVFSADASCV